MVYEFKFPDVGEGITEGTIVKWVIKIGEAIKEDQALGEIETDKAVVEIPSPRTGKILQLHIAEGDKVKVGQVMVTIDDGTGPEKPAAEKPAQAAPAEPPKKKSIGVVGELPSDETEFTLPISAKSAKHEAMKPQAAPEPGSTRPAAVNASPKVRKLAQERGIDLSKVTGSGPRGAITEADLTGEAKQQAATPIGEVPKFKVQKKYDLWGHVKRIPYKSIRKTIGDHLSTAWAEAVHVTHIEEIDVTHLVEIREREKKNAETKGIKLTYLPFVMKALVKAIEENPIVASELDEHDEAIIIKEYRNIGFAVATENGLLVPVIKGADQKSIMQIADEIVKLADAARTRKINLNDMKGGIITITNIGGLGGIAATPILNYPESSILSVMKIQELPT